MPPDTSPQSQSHFDDKSTLLFVYLSGFFIANAIVAEFVGIKVFSLERSLGFEPINLPFGGLHFSLNLTTGVLLWPLVFVMTDIINEYFGRRGVKILSYMAVALIGYAFLVIFLAIHLQPADFWLMRESSTHGIVNMQVAFEVIFGQGLWIIMGSLVAFLVGQLIDVSLFYMVKKRTGEKYLWLRATGSTLVSQAVDSFIVLFISFHLNPATQWDITLIFTMFIIKYLYKFIIAIAFTPLIYLLHNLIDAYLGEPLATELKRRAMQSYQ
ncbi:MAG: hypothetical protein BWK79_15270 [Beggiatoa sp. IS2]|nr:MAG: hypothetical protein BWK79_15270 [Beggiatoa sp. IS2]